MFGASRAAALREQLRKSRASAAAPTSEPPPKISRQDTQPHAASEDPLLEYCPTEDAYTNAPAMEKVLMDPTPLEHSTRPTESKQGDRADKDLQLPASRSAGASTSRPDADTASDRPNEGTAVAARPTFRMPLLLQTAGIDDKPRPFYNLGNSCFINASLTALFGPSPFRTAILDIFSADEQRLRNALWLSLIHI